MVAVYARCEFRITMSLAMSLASEIRRKGQGSRTESFCGGKYLDPNHTSKSKTVHLFMTSITSGTIPSEWKLHKITAVPKSGDKTSVKNYRPISLLCITSKVLERLIYDKIINSVSNCITQYQFGFQKNSSTLHQLLIYFIIIIIAGL